MARRSPKRVREEQEQEQEISRPPARGNSHWLAGIGSPVTLSRETQLVVTT